MIKAFSYLHHWFQTNDITKPVTIVIMTDSKTADCIGWALRDEGNALLMMLPSFELVKEGQIYGIPFKIEVR
jgi:hypothetical protein